MRILSFTTGPDDWKSLLADPEKHWRAGYSARALAHCWESADGFPQEVISMLGAATDPALSQVVPLLAVPEFKVPLPGGKRASQNDIFVLARSTLGPVTIMVEGRSTNRSGRYLVSGKPKRRPEKWSAWNSFCIRCVCRNNLRARFVINYFTAQRLH